MIQNITSILLLCISITSGAQVINGMVVDDEHKQAIAGVAVVNKKTAVMTLTEADGHFSIRAVPGETLVFSHMSYEGTSMIAAADHNRSLTISLVPNEFKLQKVIISSRTKYQQDSAKRHEVFSHELNKVIVPKPQVVGIGCAGCFGWIADKITGNSKKSKRFRKGFATDDQLMFIDSRYNEEVVSLLTGITDQDSIAAFIYRYPMDHEFARAATDLEIKAWIRYNYREYKAIHANAVNGVK